MENIKKPVVLCIIDGFGLSASWKGNAILTANPKNFLNFWATYPHCLLAYPNTPSNDLSLYNNPESYLSSLLEGRKNESQREYIDNKIKEDVLLNNNVLNDAFKQASEKSSSLHLIGNFSGKSGKYGDLEHLIALLRLAKKRGIYRVYTHLIMDDTGGDNDQALDSLHILEAEIAKIGLGEIASISGLNYLRDEMNAKTFKTYKAIVEGRGNFYLSAEQAINRNKKTSSLLSNIPPSVITSQGNPIARVSDFDSIIFFNHNNFELTKLITALSANSAESSQLTLAKYLFLATFFDHVLPKSNQVKSIFETENKINLPNILSNAEVNQLYLSDSSRIFSIKSGLRGLEQAGYASEDFIPIINKNKYLNNPKDVLNSIFSKAVDSIKQRRHDFIMIEVPSIDEAANYGTFDQTVKAVKAIDEFLPSLFQSIEDSNGSLILTSLYGNAEKMVQRSSYELLNNRTINPVPFILATKDSQKKSAITNIASELMCGMMSKKNHLTDIAPTILELLDLPVPKEFSGKSLVSQKSAF
ncbi:MAG: hypothetical protein WC536_04085 [Patescibacteria group bacterium]